MIFSKYLMICSKSPDIVWWAEKKISWSLLLYRFKILKHVLVFVSFLWWDFSKNDHVRQFDFLLKQIEFELCYIYIYFSGKRAELFCVWFFRKPIVVTGLTSCWNKQSCLLTLCQRGQTMQVRVPQVPSRWRPGGHASRKMRKPNWWQPESKQETVTI